MNKMFNNVLIVMAVIFWGIKIVSLLMFQTGKDFLIVPQLKFVLEIVLLFITLIALIFQARQNVIGSLLYFAIQVVYSYGAVKGNVEMNLITGFITYFALGLSIFMILNMFLIMKQRAKPVDEKRDWFFANEKFDREKDERADKNNYRIM